MKWHPVPGIMCYFDKLEYSWQLRKMWKLKILCLQLNTDEIIQYDWFWFFKLLASFQFVKEVQFACKNKSSCDQLRNIHRAIFKHCPQLKEYMNQFPHKFLYEVGRATATIQLKDV